MKLGAMLEGSPPPKRRLSNANNKRRVPIDSREGQSAWRDGCVQRPADPSCDRESPTGRAATLRVFRPPEKVEFSFSTCIHIMTHVSTVSAPTAAPT